MNITNTLVNIYVVHYKIQLNLKINMNSPKECLSPYHMRGIIYLAAFKFVLKRLILHLIHNI